MFTVAAGRHEALAVASVTISPVTLQFVQALKITQGRLRETSPEHKEISDLCRYDRMRFTYKELFSAPFASSRLCVEMNYFILAFRLVRAI